MEINLNWYVSVPPAIEPVEIDDLKEYARIDGSSEDFLIAGFIAAVREATELFLGRALITQTIIASLDKWPLKPIEIHRPPLQSITEVRTVDEDNTPAVYASTNYYVNIGPDPGTLVIKQDSDEPENDDRDSGGFQIEAIVGYGDAAEDVPQAIRTGISMWAAEIYENRVPITEPPGIVKTILAPYKMIMI